MNSLSTTYIGTRPRWTERVPDWIWATFWETVLILLAGASAWASGHPWLFASLGPTAYEQAEKPNQRSSRFYNVIVGHFVGIGAGFFGLWLIGAWSAPKVVADTYVSPARLWAAAVAVAVTTILNILLKSGQPAALSTTLLVALGAFQTVGAVFLLLAGVVIVGVAGEPVRRMRAQRKNAEPT